MREEESRRVEGAGAGAREGMRKKTRVVNEEASTSVTHTLTEKERKKEGEGRRGEKGGRCFIYIFMI